MKSQKLLLLTTAAITFLSCNVNNNDSQIQTPSTYEFTRNGESSVSFTGQTTRIKMATELSVAMTDFDNSTEELLLEMYRNQTEEGGDASPYSDPDLNAATKNIKGKVAASADYFSANTAISSEIKAQFETWISNQVNEVFPNQNVQAEPGVAGQIADGSSTRYVNSKGFEYNQLVAKGLIGALMTDQILNNYLSPSVLDAGTKREDNDNQVTEEGASFTTMEHNWDEAYGYLFGNSENPGNPIPTIGQDDDFLNEYVGKVESDEDFSGIAQEIFNAFALGRAAISETDYELRDEQALILKERISTVIAVRAIYYLQAGKTALQSEIPNYGTAFHDISEGTGFVYSLQFTHVPGTSNPYFTKTEVDGFLDQLQSGNGLWDVTSETLDNISAEIAAKFEFSVEEAAN